MTAGLFEEAAQCLHCGHRATRAFTACACPCHTQERALTATEAREAAITKVTSETARTSRSWRDNALEVLGVVARQQETLTTDDLWPHLTAPPEPRAMGGVVRKAVGAGLIVKTQRMVPSIRPENHGRDIRVWHSQVFR